MELGTTRDSAGLSTASRLVDYSLLEQTWDMFRVLMVGLHGVRHSYGDQAMLVTETVMEHLATTLGVDAFKLRTDNMYKVGTNLRGALNKLTYELSYNAYAWIFLSRQKRDTTWAQYHPCGNIEECMY